MEIKTKFKNFKSICKKIKRHLKPYTSNSKGLTISYDVDLDDVEFGNFVFVAHHAAISNSSIGKRTSVGRYDKIRSTIIGCYTSISWDVTIGAVGHGYTRLSTSSII